ncbi:MAG: zinc ABC transporter substrate-binding protein [Gammaproteobacteria bacterium (ex Lamellibrachia satsuma)]|nr:MAG: zinc ABC transporter substrate-binding protein [Gammaproteobacteria bacterium (ex Lamellibrachia satsuma)]RRS35066.1 MAG: zinc ABC transporter substrate-binding protein [Gammaproteobacteria bacterium (ex Lamellibrachia satsuma)]
MLLCMETAVAEVTVFSCEPEWKALAEEIGGDRIRAFSATTAGQDPHHIQARPSLIAKLRRADMLICSGADLEAGWLPLLLRRARNPKVLPGKPGHLMAADQVEMLEVPERLDRSEGDIHAQGNPHVHLDPENILKVARVVSGRLAEIDPDNAEHFQSSRKSFQARWTDAIMNWDTRASDLRGELVVVHHREWVYLLHWLGMQQLAALEPKPGVPPTAGHLASLQVRLGREQPLAIVRSSISDPRPSEWLSNRTGVAQVVLPYTVGSAENVNDLFSLFEEIVSVLLRVKS